MFPTLCKLCHCLERSFISLLEQNLNHWSYSLYPMAMGHRRNEQIYFQLTNKTGFKIT